MHITYQEILAQLKKTERPLTINKNKKILFFDKIQFIFPSTTLQRIYHPCMIYLFEFNQKLYLLSTYIYTDLSSLQNITKRLYYIAPRFNERIVKLKSSYYRGRKIKFTRVLNNRFKYTKHFLTPQTQKNSQTTKWVNEAEYREYLLTITNTPDGVVNNPEFIFSNVSGIETFLPSNTR